LFSGRGVDFVVVRENVEDVYAGIEHAQAPGVYQALKVITDRGCERVCRLAFEVAKAEGRKRVTCVTKANILKLTEGALKRAFERVATEYPYIKADHMLVDACAHDMVRYPERFDVIVCTNLHGDILSDLAAGLVGGLGLASSSNIGDNAAIFEAVHGTAPDIAGKDLANPTALILAGAAMLRYIGQDGRAESIERGVTAALSSGVRTNDLPGDAPGVGTAAFADAVIARLGEGPALKNRKEAQVALPKAPGVVGPVPYSVRGLDVFVEHHGAVSELVALLLNTLDLEMYQLKLITNRGAAVWPISADADLCPVFRVRVLYLKEGARDAAATLEAAGLTVCHTERLIAVDGRDEFSA
jgi:isocitrate dehydrogenase